MKLTTKALASLLIMAALTVSSSAGVSAAGTSSPTDRRQDKRFAKLIRRHDRKMELRASVLGLSGDQLKEQLRSVPISRLIRKHGFRNMQEFQTALAGKLRDELHRRGWSDQKINETIAKRLDRMAE
ncbi:MAG TPA: hypothetical protein VFK03_04155 [Candidatus Saccharimonadales bacterium]|nr:hypothetical protein [Candidatus Saccharimonadales bacterium]